MQRIANILVVDDRNEGLLAVKAVLDNPLYNVVCAESGAEALKYLLQFDFSVILLDVQMPNMDGFETASLIKTREKSKDIPIIFMSAITEDQQYVYQGYGVGAIDYILKPFDPYILKSKVSFFVDMWKKNKLIKEQQRQIYENEVKVYAQALDRLELESLRRYQYLADSIPHIVFRLNSEGKFEYFNKVWSEYSGNLYDATQLSELRKYIHADDLETINQLFQSDNHEPQDCECRILRKDGIFRWHLFRMHPEKYSETSQISAWLGTATDIHDKKQIEEDQRFLAQAGGLLISSLDYELVLQQIAESSVPYLADWCSIDIFEGTKLQSQAIAHKDADALYDLKKLHKAFLLNGDNDLGIMKVLQSKKPKLIPIINDEILKDHHISDGDFLLLKKMNIRSFMSVPLIVNDKPLGVITFCYTDGNRFYDNHSMEIAEELGRRVGLAVANSKLYKFSQEAIEIRNDFLSVASHELNTPITSLNLHLQITKKALIAGKINIEKFSRSIDNSLDQLKRLIGLVEVLLDVSRIQSGRLIFGFEQFNLSEMVHNISDRYREVLLSSHCELEVQAPEVVMVKWDKLRIEQVIINLITNAVKYAPGKIEIILNTKNRFVQIEVKDYGQGIPEDKLESIFNRFERATSDRNVSGLGLGLFIVKKIVEGHQGTIEVVSHQNSGTSFILLVPMTIENSLITFEQTV